MSFRAKDLFSSRAKKPFKPPTLNFFTARTSFKKFRRKTHSLQLGICLQSTYRLRTEIGLLHFYTQLQKRTLGAAISPADVGRERACACADRSVVRRKKVRTLRTLPHWSGKLGKRRAHRSAYVPKHGNTLTRT